MIDDCRDGRLREGDQILAIDGQVLEAAISHQAAIGILQRARGIVDLVVARGLNPDISLINSSQSPQQQTSTATSPQHHSGNSIIQIIQLLLLITFDY